MYETIQKCGNSLGIRLPNNLLESLDLNEGDRIKIGIEKDTIVIRKVGIKHQTLKERLEGFKGSYEFSEWDTGASIGDELSKSATDFTN